MSSSSSSPYPRSSSTTMSNARSSTPEHFNVLCGCRLRAPLRTALTELNVGRRILGCVNYKDDNPCKFFDWVDPPTCERGKEFGNLIVKKNMDLLKDRENGFGLEIEQWQKREEWFEVKINCMTKKLKELEDGFTLKMKEWKMNEDWNALEMEDLETKNEELMLKIDEVEAKNEELRLKIEDLEAKNVIFRGRNKLMKEEVELANVKVKLLTAIVVILVGIGIVYFGGKGWLKKKMLALP
ncbi:hypothetical protein RHGRI_007593 [Rhododendron griersonianum]|uniref:GRF-type domain-containing protein n=1 Tax=Rhododendron griersonianum TaxID=479676 RepID=A0AAV6KY42_9ERIC|nr:hypothetical protein RHGRI_007593 [Rhododendron griersonianum]